MQKAFNCDTIYRDYIGENLCVLRCIVFFVETGVFMQGILSFTDTFREIGKAILSFNSISDILDVLLVAFVIYSAIKLIRETRAIQLAKGFVLLAAVYALVYLLKMQVSTYLFSMIFSNILLVLVVIFAPEIRHALESVGRSKVGKLNFLAAKNGDLIHQNEEATAMINAVTKACANMSDKKVGALMVFEKKSILGDVISTGTKVDAKVSTELIENLFFPNAALHDGAVIFRENRVCAAGCILPLVQQNRTVSSELGTRHRAAIGMSEQSDAVVVVVSEETGAISYAYKGTLNRNLSTGDLREVLTEHFIVSEPNEKNHLKNILKGRRKNGSE